MDNEWPFASKIAAIATSLVAALLLIWFREDYWSRLIGWAVVIIDVMIVVVYVIRAGHEHSKPPEGH